MQENWKDTIGTYQVSNYGEVRNKKTGNVLRQSKSRKGYKRITLLVNGMHKSYLVHRLIAEAFIPNTNNLPQINHIDGNKENNCASNLEWVNNSQNQKHAYKNGLRSKKKGKENYNAIQVLQFDLNNQFIKEWDCIKEASKELNIIDCDISFCCKGKRKTAGGYIWRYKD